MSKKIWLAAIGALLLAATVATVAMAAPAHTGAMYPPNPPGPRGGLGRGPFWGPPHLSGEITAIGEDSFTVTTAENNEVTVEVTEFTSYLGELESFADLDVGMDVAMFGHRSGEGTVTAHVVAMRDDLPLGVPLGGEVTTISADSLTIETLRGQVFTFDVTAETDYLSRENAVISIADIEVGDHVMVLYEQASSGELNATVILVGNDPQ
jgi:predicted acyltransferase (DUF342 family)